MGKTVFITEKPSVAMEYKKVLQVDGERKNGYIEGFSKRLGKEVFITWAVGHLISLAPPPDYKEEWGVWKKENLPMIPQVYKYKPVEKTKDQLNVVKTIYTRNDLDAIYYAGDSGREGIYIQALIRNNIFKNQPQIAEYVVWIDSFTEESILNGIKNAKPYSSYQNMINSGYLRAISDWLIGMNFTEAFTIASGGYGNVINIGRVMTPTLAMIVKRQEEIDSFRKVSYYGIMTDEKIYWKADKTSRFYESPDLYNENGFLKKEKAEALIGVLKQDMALTVEDVNVVPKKEYAPYNYNLADLQADCSKRYKISPKDSLAIAQSLYEKKLTTYPRTDSRFLTEAVAKDLKRFGFNVPKRYINDAKVTDHYAIIPTFAKIETDSLPELEQKVYGLILTRFKNTLLPPFVYDAVSVSYRHSCKEPFFEAFRIVRDMGFKKDLSNENTEESYLNKPVPKKGTRISVKEFLLRELETKPPVPYTTGTLILAMEKAGKLIEDEELREQIKTCGIGTSATRADIIEKLASKGTVKSPKVPFITIDKAQKIAPTEKGKAVIKIVSVIDEQLVSPIKTADMEMKLQSISDGSLSKEVYMAELNTYIENTVEAIFKGSPMKIQGGSSQNNGQSDSYDCPNCKGTKTVSKGKFGWYCKNKCGILIGKIYGKDMTDKQVTDLLNGKSVTVKGKYTNTVLPELLKTEWNGKEYYTFKVQKK